jgi:hypothetical protein
MIFLMNVRKISLLLMMRWQGEVQFNGIFYLGRIGLPSSSVIVMFDVD